MTFWDHVDALRGVLIRIAGVVGVLGIVAFCAMPWMFDNVILAPCHPDFPTYRLLESIASNSPLMPDMGGEGFDVQLVSVELATQFFVHLSSSCWTAAIVGFPIIIYLMWSFVAPGLYPHEKRGIKRAFLFGNAMFYAGAAVGYFVVFPLALRFLATYSLSETIKPMLTLDSYMDNFFLLILSMGAVFELPLLAWLLGKIGVLTRDFFGRFRRHAIVVLLTAAAIITPTGDPFTLFVVFVPLYFLWEVGALLVPPTAKEVED